MELWDFLGIYGVIGLTFMAVTGWVLYLKK